MQPKIINFILVKSVIMNMLDCAFLYNVLSELCPILSMYIINAYNKLSSKIGLGRFLVN